MKKRNGILGVLIAILALGIGYAAVSAITLTIDGEGTITPDQNNFQVVYSAVEVTSKSDDSITTTQTTNNTENASFTVSNMTKQGDTVTFTYTIKNLSTTLAATLGTPNVAYDDTTSSEYFTVTSPAPASATLAAGGTATTTQTVTVTAKKTPIGDTDITGGFTITLQATPSNS